MAMATKETGIMSKMGVATIGPAAWRNNTLNEIQVTQSTMKRSDNMCMKGRATDALPNLRDVLASLSNEEAHCYFRDTRSIVCLLRESLIDTNVEIKSLTRTKEALENTLDHIRKDIKLNLDSVNVRKTRPLREKLHDGADDLLSAERMQLLNMKQMLESQLSLVHQQLRILDASRRRLSKVIQERTRVTELVCLANNSSPTITHSALTCRHITKMKVHHRPLSATASDHGMMVDPLGPYTPEANAALQESRDARARCAMLKRQAQNVIGNVQNIQQAVHNSVNSGINSKLAETAQLKQRLDVKTGENRLAINRCSRYFDNTEQSWANSRGPMMTESLTLREKLDRPIIKVFQRHPGNNVPEAQEIVKGGDGLLTALHATSQNLGMLRLAQMRMHQDSLDKNGAIHVDGDVVRMRRRKANHRWVPGQAY